MAAAEGISERALVKLAKRWGIILPRRAYHRRVSGWILEKHAVELDRLAVDLGTGRAGALERVLSAALEEGAHVARAGRWG